MLKKIEYTKDAVKAIGQMDVKTKRRLKSAIEAIPRGDIKQLRGVNDLYRLRVGDLRVLFSYPDKDTILIEKISPRGDAYKGGILS